MDYWFAECVPCRWHTKHETQDAAILAAEAHVAIEHPKVPRLELRDKRMGHVQLRGDDAIGHEMPAPAEGYVPSLAAEEATVDPRLPGAHVETAATGMLPSGSDPPVTM